MNRKLLFTILGVIVLLSSIFIVYKCCGDDSKELRRNAVLQIAQKEINRLYPLSGNKYYTYDTEKLDDGTWYVYVSTKSLNPNTIIAGGGCQMIIHGITGEILQMKFLQ